MKHYQQQTIEGDEIIVDSKNQHYFGPSLILRNCKLTLLTNEKAFTISQVQLENCVVDAKKALTNFQGWCKARICRCKFLGTFIGNDFGNLLELGEEGAILSCDFSEAILDGCRFFGCEPDTVEFPRWPCFTILNPHQYLKEIGALSWPEKLGLWAEGLTWSPESTIAETNYAPEVVRKFGGSQDELRQLLHQLTNVVL